MRKSNPKLRLLLFITSVSKPNRSPTPKHGFIKCIEEDWHLEEKLILPEPIVETSDFEKNKALAQRLVQRLESAPRIQICLRSDFPEIGRFRCQTWQIFFSEVSNEFVGQVKSAYKNSD